MTRLVKIWISLGLWCWDVLAEALLRIGGRKASPRCVILYYHAITDAQRAGFARQMDEVVRLVQPIALNTKIQLQPGHRYCAVTFDDGFISVLDNALPELERRSIPATLFVPTGCLGQRPAWIRDASRSSYQEEVVSESRLATLSGHPWLSIGSHSITHPRMASLSVAECRREFRESKSELERILGQPVQLFSLPHGSYDPNVIAEARSVGYRQVFGVAPALAFATEGEFLSGRIATEPDDGPLEFRLKLLGAYRWMCWASKVKAILWAKRT